MSQSVNQQYLKSILETIRFIVSDGRLTYGDAVYILEQLLGIDWQKDVEVLVDQPEPPMTQKVMEPGRPSDASVASGLSKFRSE